MGAYARAPSGLAEQQDVLWVAAEGCDVGLHPRERRALVEETVVPGCIAALLRQRRMRQETEGAESVVQCDDHRVTACGEGGAVVQRFRRASEAERAAVHEDHDRTRRIWRERGRPDIESKAVFVVLDGSARRARGLRAVRTWRRRVEGRFPRRRGLRRTPAQGSDGRSGERDAAKGEGAGLRDVTQDGAVRGVHPPFGWVRRRVDLRGVHGRGIDGSIGHLCIGHRVVVAAAGNEQSGDHERQASEDGWAPQHGPPRTSLRKGQTAERARRPSFCGGSAE